MAADAYLDEITVPQAQRLPYERCRLWQDQQEVGRFLFSFWDSETDLLYVVEHFQ